MNWGILGSAKVAVENLMPAIQRSPNDKLIIVASRTIEKAHDLAKKFDCDYTDNYDKLVQNEKIDSVYIPLPNSMHFEWAKKALSNGKHVLIEKPAVMNLEQAKELVDLSRKKNLALIENFQFQTHSQHNWVRLKMEEGLIGTLKNFRSSFCFPQFENVANIRYAKSLGGGAIYDTGAYVIKAVSFVLDSKMDILSACFINNDDFGVNWHGSIHGYIPEHNIPCQLYFGFDNDYECSYELIGTAGSIKVMRAFTAKKNHKPKVIIQKNAEIEIIELQEDDHFVNMLRHFSNSISNGLLEVERIHLMSQSQLLSSVIEKATRH